MFIFFSPFACVALLLLLQRVCVPAPEAAKLPEREEDGGDEEGNLLLRCFPHPCSLTAGVTLAHTWSRVRRTNPQNAV